MKSVRLTSIFSFITLANHKVTVLYLLFGHDHAHNAQRLLEGPWYLGAGDWMHCNVLSRLYMET